MAPPASAADLHARPYAIAAQSSETHKAPVVRAITDPLFDRPRRFAPFPATSRNPAAVVGVSSSSCGSAPPCCARVLPPRRQIGAMALRLQRLARGLRPILWDRDHLVWSAAGELHPGEPFGGTARNYIGRNASKATATAWARIESAAHLAPRPLNRDWAGMS